MPAGGARQAQPKFQQWGRQLKVSERKQAGRFSNAGGDGMIAFIANSLCALNGADLMSHEIVRGLMSAQLHLTVVSSDSPGVITGLNTAGLRPSWLAAPDRVARAIAPGGGNRRRPVVWLRDRAEQWTYGGKLSRISTRGIVVNGFSNHWVFKYAQFLKIPRILVVHDSPRRFGVKDQPALAWALARMGCYSHYIFPAQQVAEEWLAFRELAGKQFCYIPNCCREDAVRQLAAHDRQAVRARLGMPRNRFVVVCPATIQYRKGQDLLLDNFAELQAAVPTLQIYLVGAPLGDWGAALTQRIKRSAFREQIAVLGPRINALDYIYAADALVLPSRSEVAPLVILEAMALQTPVIATAVGGVAELLEHGRSGLLFAPENADELNRALFRVAGDPQLRSILSNNAAHRYWSRFSRAHLVQRYGTALHRLVAGKSWTDALPDLARHSNLSERTAIIRGSHSKVNA